MKLKALISFFSARIVLTAGLAFLAGGAASAQSTWTTRTTGTIKTLRGITFDGVRFVCVADEGVILTSTDGVSWTAANSGTVMSLRSVTSSPSLIVASGESGTILTSVDGSTWTGSTTPVGVANKFLSGVAYGSSKYVAVGSSGKIIYSSDALSWVEVPSVPVPLFLQSVGFGNGTFVTVGVSGTIMYSTDAVTWSAAGAGTNNYLTGVAHGAGKFVIVGQSGTILTSADGTLWTSRTSGSAAWLRSVIFADGRFVAAGDEGTILTSEDGIVWDAQTSGIVESGFGVSYGSGKFVLVGGKVEVLDPGISSRIITSPTGLDQGFRWAMLTKTVNEPAGVVTLNILRIGPVTGSVTLQWSVTGGTATHSEDFPDAIGTVIFASGESSKEVSISITDDSLMEGSETMEISLAAVTPNWRVHGTATMLVTIIDDEDSDGDLLADVWEIFYFGSVTAYDSDDDPDGDHNNNAREFADDTDPSSSSSAKYFLTTIIDAGNGTVGVSPVVVAFSPGDFATVTATAAPGFNFERWSNPGFPLTNSHTITMNADILIGARFILTLAESLDQSGMEWYDNTYSWEGQTAVTSDGVDAAFADGNNIYEGESAILEALVPGNTTIKFKWKCSTAINADFFQFLIDGEPKAAISGEQDWVERTYNLPAGFHILTWSFDRSYFSPEGLNGVWLDAFRISQSFSQWQLDHFTAGEIQNPLVSGVSADPDGDGHTNYTEYGFGTNPKANGQSLAVLPLLERREVSGELKQTVIFERPVTRFGDVNYVLEFSTTLESGSWIALTPTEEVISALNMTQKVRLIDPALLSGRGFYRISLIQK